MDKYGVFISIPKCASKTIMEMYELGHCRDNDNDCKNNNYIIFENHQRLSILEKRYDLNDKFIFTFVRNPYSRVVSWFNFHKSNPVYSNLSLNEWVKKGCPHHWKRQNATHWDRDKLSPLLQYNFIDSNFKVDYIGKMETFEEDNDRLIEIINTIFELNNIPKRIKYKKTHRTKGGNSTNEKLTEESKEIIYNLFKKDFEYFGYEK